MRIVAVTITASAIPCAAATARSTLSVRAILRRHDRGTPTNTRAKIPMNSAASDAQLSRIEPGVRE
jgi:hypothetical protein